MSWLSRLHSCKFALRTFCAMSSDETPPAHTGQGDGDAAEGEVVVEGGANAEDEAAYENPRFNPIDEAANQNPRLRFLGYPRLSLP